MPFSGVARVYINPGRSNLKTEQQPKLMVGYVYKEKSFDIIFNMGYGGGVLTTSLPMDYGSGKSPIDERVNHPSPPSPFYSTEHHSEHNCDDYDSVRSEWTWLL